MIFAHDVITTQITYVFEKCAARTRSKSPSEPALPAKCWYRDLDPFVERKILRLDEKGRSTILTSFGLGIHYTIPSAPPLTDKGRSGGDVGLGSLYAIHAAINTNTPMALAARR